MKSFTDPPVFEKFTQTNYLEVIKVMARTSTDSFYVVDYQKRRFDYVSDNPMFLYGFNAQEVMGLEFDFFFKYLSQSDVESMQRLNAIMFEYFHKIPKQNKKQYTISADLYIKCNQGNRILIHLKLTPLIISESGDICKAVCAISPSNENNSGNIKIYKDGDNLVSVFDFRRNEWMNHEKIELTFREREILLYSIRGFSIKEIADTIFLSVETVKYHRKKLFEKLEVKNIAEAIALTNINKLIC
ncbi:MULTISPECIES: response regulator transcription factor [Arenibacter]|uniref:response regulator transcription factor n=1 Tax=Arenibacter TaxID=178469 RepID=UPI000A3D393C|nr:MULTISPECIES: LuxR C-terminal-related transcriptional regulator [Arenibacter]